MPTTDDIQIIYIGIPGPPGTGVSAANWNTIRADVNTLQALVPGSLAGLTDTNIVTPLDGQLLVRDGPSSKWVNKTIGEAVRYAKNNNSVVLEHMDRLNADVGLQLVQNGGLPTQADLSVIYGTTAGTAASGDHQHSAVFYHRAQFGATGVLSSGSRTLYTFSIPVPSGVDWILEAQAFATLKNNVNNGTLSLGIRLGASPTYLEETEAYETVGGVPRLAAVETSRPLVGGGSITVTVRAIFGSGDPIDIRAGRVIVRCYPRR